MANTAYHTRPQTRPTRRRPDDLRILQVYEYEKRERGTRGAYRRAGDMLSVSDETVRRIVHAAEQREQAKAEEAAAGLEYTPPPFADELATWRAQRDVTSHAMPQTEPQPASNATMPVMSSRADQDAQNGAHVASAVANAPQVDDATRHMPELPEGSPEVPPAPQEPEAPEPPPASSPEDPEPPQQATPGAVSFRSTSPTVAAYLERRHQLVDVAPARHVGLVPMMWQSEYRGVWLGVFVALLLILVCSL